MVEADGSNRIETPQIVLAWVIQSVPRHHIEGCMALLSSKKVTGKFGRQCPLRIRIFIKVGHRCLKVSRVGKTVGSNWAEFWELKVSLI
jgi:hypothetical protein